ncbi:hypothetical protein AYO20_05896 [Fonsecaea nubica]|uniref:Uncharacterized protein n=1 Tax=Fonsecaea nubica TaxID=856822 RepID=A0A178D1C6_9EURO|nr:hypothetical protein AYO20_05896 [Fonsecaea nubica]OAL34935.1 hypothetical protein AYO20_05896 [Fonsecaea nubica]
MSSLQQKRPCAEEQTDTCEAKRFNLQVFQKIRGVLSRDGTADITTVPPKTYSERLAAKKGEKSPLKDYKGAEHDHNDSLRVTVHVPDDNVVIKCHGDIALKIITRSADYTEFTAMKHLEGHKPGIPATRSDTRC